MPKPNCKCNQELIKKIKEINNINDIAFVYFRDENILNGSLASVVIIEEKTTTKSGKQRNKNSYVNVIHKYCPFCGSAYKTDTEKI